MDIKYKYYWTFRIESSRYYGAMDSDSLGFITEENKEAWQRFIQNKISELMKPETLDSKEFKECLAKVQEEKRKREEYDRREKELRIKHADERRRRSSMERPKVELQRKKNSQTGQRCTCFFLNYARKTIKNLFICRKKCNFAANFAYFGMLSQDDDTSWRFLELNN